MKITFKDVAQGDTIILEWEADKESKIGIIDCKQTAGKNLVVEHLERLNWGKKPIEFIILSHPHYDHFSGMMSLLTYCENNEIPIKIFGHSFSVEQRYLDWSNLLEDRNGKLAEMIDKVIEMEKTGQIHGIEITTKRWTLSLNKQYTLHSLRPSDFELRTYTEKVRIFERNKDYSEASKQANLFSTIFSLEFDQYFLLFTSDAALETINRILAREQDMEHFEGKRVILVQIPHHGSKKNHQITFWETLKSRVNTPAVVSSGNNDKYKHPHYVVLKEFDEANYKIYATNHIYGMLQFLNEKAQNKSDKLDMDSEPISSSSGDQSFVIKRNIATPVPKE